MNPSRGSNLPAIASWNQTVVLDAIRRAGGLSRVEIAQHTGLSAQTVGTVSRRLLSEGLIDETGTVVNGPGQPRRTLSIRADGRFSVGVHVDPAVLTFVVLDLEGTVVDHAVVRTPSGADPREVIDTIVTQVTALLDSPDRSADRVLGIGIAAPGPIDIETGTVLHPPALPRWRDVDLREAVGRGTGLSVLLDKDVVAAVVGERWLDVRDPAGDPDGDHVGRRGDFAFIYYGTGLGSGLVLNNEVLRGRESIAGNLGHLTVDDRGRPCTCGRVGCVSALVTPQALVLRAIDEGVLPVPDGAVDVTDMDSVERPFRQLTDLADAGDAGALRVLHEAGDQLARAVVVVANLLDLDEFVFGGPFWIQVAPHLLEPMRVAVASSAALVPGRPIRLSTTRIGRDVIAVGAACLVLDAGMSPHPATMLISTAPAGS